MSAISTSISGVLDRLLDQLQRRREHAMAEAPTASRSLRIAELYEQEAPRVVAPVRAIPEPHPLAGCAKRGGIRQSVRPRLAVPRRLRSRARART